ncbi:MAG: hypothetical protein FJX78_05580, partial [Armatimonadetes bacterium]|nr:hypothetical protein [Armatimonadota bacterium]
MMQAQPRAARRARPPAYVAASALVATVFLLLAAPVFAQQKSYDHPLIEQKIRLLADGDALVNDVRTYRFTGSFSRADLRLRATGKYGSYDIEYLGVHDAATNAPVPYETARDGNERILRWTYRAADETKRFAIRYRIR